ncbi:MAG: peptide chain release factor 2 [Chloroflexi bacterium]|nr:peptide chain release factor 2 [Chloroflexota bacterium]
MASKEKEIAGLEERSASPGFWSDQETARKLLQRMANLKESVDTWRGLERRARDAAELIDLAVQEEDASLGASIQSDVASLEAELRRLEFQLQFSGPYDERTAILAVHAGAGGTESQDWAEMLMRMYLRWGERSGYKAQVIDIAAGDEAGVKSATIEIAGRWAYGYLKAERGVHRLVRISPFDASHARHTSFVLVEVMPESEGDVELQINPDDLKIDVFRAGGHGGQNVQKTSTAVRITHLPTGLVVVCQNERSQLQNKELAMKVLHARLMNLQIKRQQEEQARIKGEHIPAEWGNQIRSYVLHPYKMVKDHRTGYETSDTGAVLDGELGPLLEAYLLGTVGKGEG